jgi:hypothetical protein
MSDEQLENLAADITALRHMVIALALASPKLENVLAELARQQETITSALVQAPVSDRYIELVRSRLQALYEALAAQV